MTRFLDYISGIRTLNDVLSKGALIAPPTIASFSSINPTWPDDAGLIIGFFISVLQLAIAAYIFTIKGLSKKKLDVCIKRCLVVAVALLVFYFICFSAFTFDSKIGQIGIGFVFQKPQFEGLDTEFLLESAEFDPLRIWVPWTVYATRIGILFIWIAFFVTLCAFFAFFYLKSNFDKEPTKKEYSPITPDAAQSSNPNKQ